MRQLLLTLGLIILLTGCSLELYDEYPIEPYRYYPRYYVPNYPFYYNPYYRPYYYRPYHSPNPKPSPNTPRHYGPRK